MAVTSVRATKLALAVLTTPSPRQDSALTLALKKFLDIARYAGLAPSAIVVVATLRALKYNGGA